MSDYEDGLYDEAEFYVNLPDDEITPDEVQFVNSGEWMMHDEDESEPEDWDDE